MATSSGQALSCVAYGSWPQSHKISHGLSSPPVVVWPRDPSSQEDLGLQEAAGQGLGATFHSSAASGGSPLFLPAWVCPWQRAPLALPCEGPRVRSHSGCPLPARVGLQGRDQGNETPASHPQPPSVLYLQKAGLTSLQSEGPTWSRGNVLETLFKEFRVDALTVLVTALTPLPPPAAPDPTINAPGTGILLPFSLSSEAVPAWGMLEQDLLYPRRGCPAVPGIPTAQAAVRRHQSGHQWAKMSGCHMPRTGVRQPP